MAKILRWRILANQSFSLREADLILGGDSLVTLTTLMRESWKKPRTLFVCAAWVSFEIRCSMWGAFVCYHCVAFVVASDCKSHNNLDM